jgi:hypothetical protein
VTLASARVQGSDRWSRCGRGSERASASSPRELRTGFAAIDRLEAFDPPDIPTLYLFGEATDASIFATPDEVAAARRLGD